MRYILAFAMVCIGCNTAPEIGASGGGAGGGGSCTSPGEVTRAMTGPLEDLNSGLMVLAGFGLVKPDGSWAQTVEAPDGSVIDRVTAYVDPAGQPTPQRPTLTFWKKNITTGAQDEIGASTDDTDVNDYPNVHGFGPKCLGEVVDATSTIYWVTLTGEGGAGKKDMSFLGSSVTYGSVDSSP